ncbi:MAG: DUF5719 family protein [Acidimicrobiia bacterium]
MRRVWRTPALVVLAALLAAAVVLAQGSSSRTAPPAPAREPSDGPTVPSRRNVSAAWYCAEGTSTPDGRATEAVIIGNLERYPIDVTITVMPGGSEEPSSRKLSIDTLAQRRVEVADVLATPEPGVVVEVFGGQAVVEHEVRRADDFAVNPCTRTADRTWFFTGVSTDRGAQEWLALFNPFGDDAIVDVTFLTANGVDAPGETQALVVPRRSRVSLPVHDLVSREPEVAISVVARTGRVVAESSTQFDGTDVRRGLSLSPGVNNGARHWRFPSGASTAGTTRSVSIANFGDVAADVEVDLFLDNGSNVPPERVTVSPMSITTIDVGQRVAAGVGYAIDVRVVQGAPVVVDASGAWAPPAPVTGVASTPGSVTTATRWALALGRTTESDEAVIAVLNVGTAPVTVQLYAYTAGDPDSPRSAPAAAVPAGALVEFALTERGIRPDQVLVVSADGPIVVGRQVLGTGVSVSVAVPFARAVTALR